MPYLPASILSKTRTSLSALRHRDFRLLFLATFASNAGSWMQKVATSWLVYQMTGSQAWLGAEAFASGFTTALLLPFGGAIADRVDRRTLLVWTNIISAALAALLALLAATHALHVWHILAIATASGIVQALIAPASTSLLPALVGEADVPNAIALNSLQFNLSRVVGPIIGGLTLTQLGPAWSFGLNATSFLALVLAFTLVRSVPPASPSKLPLTQSLLEGLSFVRSRHDLILLLTLVSAGAFLGAPVISLLPALVVSLGRQATDYSALLSYFGAGAVLAAITATLTSTSNQRTTLLAAALAITGAAQALLAIANWDTTRICVFFAGFGFVGVMIILGTLLIQHTDNAFRGRVSSLQQIAFRASQPLGALLGGIAAQHFGIRPIMALAGCSLLTLCLLANQRTLSPPKNLDKNRTNT